MEVLAGRFDRPDYKLRTHIAGRQHRAVRCHTPRLIMLSSFLLPPVFPSFLPSNPEFQS